MKMETIYEAIGMMVSSFLSGISEGVKNFLIYRAIPDVLHSDAGKEALKDMPPEIKDKLLNDWFPQEQEN